MRSKIATVGLVEEKGEAEKITSDLNILGLKLLLDIQIRMFIEALDKYVRTLGE